MTLLPILIAALLQAGEETAASPKTPEDVNPTPTMEAVPVAERSADEEPMLVPVDIGLMLHTRYRLTDVQPRHQFEARRARINLNVRPTPWLTGRIELDAADAPAFLKDAYVELSISSSLAITAGQFKKPFSYLALLSPRVLPLWRRGTVIQHISDDLNFGGRDIGVMASGEVSRFGWALGVFNGNGTWGEVDSGKSVAARLTARPGEIVRLGLSGTMAYRNAVGLTLARRDTYAAGVDARVRAGPVDWVTELLWAMDASVPEGNHNLGIVSYVLWTLEGPRGTKLQPILKLEALDTNLRQRDPLTWSATAGLNVRLAKALRLMVQGEIVRTSSSAEFTQHAEHARNQLVVMLAYDQWLELKGAL